MWAHISQTENKMEKDDDEEQSFLEHETGLFFS